MANNKARNWKRSWTSSIYLILPQPSPLRQSSRPVLLFRKIRFFFKCSSIKNCVFIPRLLHLIHILNPSQLYTFQIPNFSDVYKSHIEWKTCAGQTYRRRIYIKIQVNNCFMSISLLKYGFRITACWRIKKVLSVHLDLQRKKLHFCTVVTWQAGKFRLLCGSSQIYSLFFDACPGVQWILWLKQ